MWTDVSIIDIELTTKCNAACPQCARNYYGGKTWPSLPLVDLDFDVIKKSLGPVIKNFAPSDSIKLCGTYGDPCLYPKFLELVEWILELSKCKIIINTNGSLRTVAWWSKLGNMLGNRGHVFFGLDGLEDTHSLHRIGTNFNKIIKNLKAFNQAGGKSTWSFLIFKHNQHQINEAELLSKECGCEHFAIKSTSRFVNKQHELINFTEVYNRKGYPIFKIYPTDHQDHVNQGYSTYQSIINNYGTYKNYLDTVEISCQSKVFKTVSITAEGYVLPCGFLVDRFYGHEAENHSDREKLFNLINSNGGFDSIDIHKTDFHSIISGSVFAAIENSWTSDRLGRCAHQCGVSSTLLAEANKHLNQIVEKITK